MSLTQITPSTLRYTRYYRALIIYVESFFNEIYETEDQSREGVAWIPESGTDLVRTFNPFAVELVDNCDNDVDKDDVDKEGISLRHYYYLYY